MDETIPPVREHQLGIFDALVDRDELARGVSSVPLSERAILREDEGSDASGHRRKAFGEEVESGLLALFHQMQQAEGYDLAVLGLFSVIAKDPDFYFISPRWIRELFEEERELLMETFSGKTDNRWPELGESKDDDEDEKSFIYNSWKESALDAIEKELCKRVAELVPDESKFADRKVVRELLKPLTNDVLWHLNDLVERVQNSGALLLVAREETEPAFIYGWLAATVRGDLMGIAYCYTKAKFRRLGTMTALLLRVLQMVPDEARLVYCARSARDDVFERYGFSHMRLSEMLGKAVAA
jgi:hypothetical protein